MKNKEIQSGRSMVEMLGVLAIIGVLSVGGIAGYSMAMKRHALNEIMAKTNLVLFDINSNRFANEDFGYGDGSMRAYLDASPLVQDLENTTGILEIGSNGTNPAIGIRIDRDKVDPSDICEYIKLVKDSYFMAYEGSCLGCASGNSITSSTNCQSVNSNIFSIWIAP